MIGAIVGAKDDAELIVPCLERLRAIGVGPIVVLDDYSTDGTAQIVDRLAFSDRQLARILPAASLAETLNRSGPVLSHLLDTNEPEWILFTDADEFWVCASGALDDLLRETTADAFAIERFNVPLMDPAFVPSTGSDPSLFLDASLIVSRRVLSRREMDQSRDQRWIMHAVMPKLVCRADRIGSFDPGGHRGRYEDGSTMLPVVLAAVVIVHLPFTTWQRFARKVENARAFLDRWREYYPGDAAWHWKRWAEIADAGGGGLQREFEREVIRGPELEVLRRSGVVSTAGDLLRERTTICR